MKTLIIYLSVSGNTQWVAQHIHRNIPDSDLVKIELKGKPLKNKFWRTFLLGFKVSTNQEIPIQPVNVNLDSYDKIILGAPVWMGKVPPPFETFIKTIDFTNKKVAAFGTYGGGDRSFFNHFKEIIGKPLDASILLRDPLNPIDEDNYFQIFDYVNDLKSSWFPVSNVA